jgi:hypothetical protein
MQPNRCYFCNNPARVEEGRNSFLVDCPNCQICYEMDFTAWSAKCDHVDETLSFVRQQLRMGRLRPFVSLEHVCH